MPLGRAEALFPAEDPLAVEPLPVFVPAAPVVVPPLMPVPLALPVVPELPLALPVVPDTFELLRI